MPFRAAVFREAIGPLSGCSANVVLLRLCDSYDVHSSPLQKARCIRSMMAVLDTSFDEHARRRIMEACGRRCLGHSVLDKALRLKRKSRDFDHLLELLNDAHIGGEHLRREGDIIHASYDRCHCGSVSKTKEPFSATYCHSSCGWFQQLFEALLQKPVEVELLGSIIQGDNACRFVIRF